MVAMIIHISRDGSCIEFTLCQEGTLLKKVRGQCYILFAPLEWQNDDKNQ